MRAIPHKPIAVALTALLLGLGVAAATTTPAEAWGHRWHGGWGWGAPAVELGILGFAAGAALASPYYYYPGPYYPYPYYGYGPHPCMRPLYDRWGRIYRWVPAC